MKLSSLLKKHRKASLTESEMKSRYGAPVLKNGLASMYRMDTPSGRSTPYIEWVVAYQCKDGSFEIARTCKTRKEALRWVELYSK